MMFHKSTDVAPCSVHVNLCCDPKKQKVVKKCYIHKINAIIYCYFEDDAKIHMNTEIMHACLPLSPLQNQNLIKTFNFAEGIFSRDQQSLI